MAKPQKEKQGLTARLRRMVRYHFIVPMLRNANAPNHVARGAFWGTLVAMTPTVGIQIATCCVFWFVLRTLNRRWDFSLIVATAWTGITNFFTAAPFYYLFLVTGQALAGQWDDIGGFAAFDQELVRATTMDVPLWQSAWLQTAALFEAFGVPLVLGSIPWALGSAIAAYIWSRKFVLRVQRRRFRHV